MSRGGAATSIDEVIALITPEGVVGLASDLIRIPSPTEAEQKVAAYVESTLMASGVETYRQQVEPGRFQVVGLIPGTGDGRSLMFNGHLDNDSLTSDWADQDPYHAVVKGNHLWGAGIHNMKSGIAAMLAAFLAVHKAGIRLRGDLLVACVVGELQGGKGTLHLLESGIRTDFAIVPEPYSVSRIITKSVGVHKCSITTHGRSVHTSRSETGIDAIQKMIEVINRLRELNLGVSDPTLPGVPRVLVASIIGGRGPDYDLAGPSNVSDICTCIIDVRYPPGITSAAIDARFRGFLADLMNQDPDLRCEYQHPVDPRFRVGGADMPPTDVDPRSEIVRLVASMHERLTGATITEIGTVLPFSYTGNDTAHLQRAGIECCLYGPRGDPQDVERHVRIDEMVTCAKVLAGVAVEICGDGSGPT